MPLLVIGLVVLLVVAGRLAGGGVVGEDAADAAGPSEGPGGLAAPGLLATAPPAADPAAPRLAADGWEPLTSAPIPARTRHTATWTGQEVIVFGGQPDPGELTGARLDPAAGTWSPMAPSPLGSRAGHTATWTGREVVVVEGAPVSQVGAVAAQAMDGAAYDPEADAWRPIADAPINPRSGHVAVWTGREVFVYGGSRSFDRLAPAALYDPVADSWRLTSPSPLARAYGTATAVWTGQEVVVLMGTGDADVAAYDPATDTWRLLPGSPVAMRTAAAVWTGEEVLLLGLPSARVEADGTSVLVTSATDVGGVALDPATGRWTLLPPSPLQFFVTAPVVWTGEAAVVVGGLAERPGAVWTPSTARWSALPPADRPMTSGHAAVWADDRLVVWGGQGMGEPLATGLALEGVAP